VSKKRTNFVDILLSIYNVLSNVVSQMILQDILTVLALAEMKIANLLNYIIISLLKKLNQYYHEKSV